MDTIYKYRLRVTDEQTLVLPAEAQILSVKLLEVPYLWAVVDPEAQYKERREVQIIGTGHPINEEALDGYEFLDTLVDKRAGATFIWHVFVSGPAESHFRE